MACGNEFDQLASVGGFSGRGGYGYWFEYLAINEGNRNYVISTTDELLKFLEPIDTMEEASFLAKAHRYGWSENDYDTRTTGIREVDGGFELVVDKTVSGCPNLEIRRFDLLITTAGEIQERDSQVVEKYSGCVY